MTAPAPTAAVTAPQSTPRGRFTKGLIYDVFTALERYGYRRPDDDRRLGQAVGMLFKLASVYEGSCDDLEVTS